MEQLTKWLPQTLPECICWVLYIIMIKMVWDFSCGYIANFKEMEWKQRISAFLLLLAITFLFGSLIAMGFTLKTHTQGI